MARLAASTLATVFGTLLFTFVTVFNGYCGDSVSADEESQCTFNVPTQAFYFGVALLLLGGLAAFGASKLPAVRESWRWIAAGAATVALSIIPWLLLVSGTRGRLDYWHYAGQRGNPDDHIRDAAWIVLIIPFVAWAVAGASRRSARLFAFAMALAAGSWMAALSYSSWYYDRHL